MGIDLITSNKAGISLQNIIDVLVDKSVSKKDIQASLNTTSNIDPLLKKLEDSLLIKKEKKGTKVLYSVCQSEPQLESGTVLEVQVSTTKKIKKATKDKVETPVVEPVIDVIHTPPVVEEQPKPTKRKVTKASPKSDMTPAEVKNINTQTEIISKDHQITALVQIDDDKKNKKTAAPKTEEVNEDNLELLRQELSGRLGKEVTAVLHKRNDRALKERKKSAQEIYEAQKSIASEPVQDEAYDTENPYRFVMNFFTSTLNGEKATPYFRRRDEYVVKSIYNKFKALCETVDDYAVTPQNLPFYRVITINEQEKLVKIYHIDMNRIVRGVHTLFRLNRFDDMFLKFQ